MLCCLDMNQHDFDTLKIRSTKHIVCPILRDNWSQGVSFPVKTLRGNNFSHFHQTNYREAPSHQHLLISLSPWP